MAARAHDKQAIDGPYLRSPTSTDFRRVAGRSAALGFDGKWVLHPGADRDLNEVYSPGSRTTTTPRTSSTPTRGRPREAGGARGAAMLGEEMIDEASRKMALVIAGKGRAAGMPRTDRWSPPPP